MAIDKIGTNGLVPSAIVPPDGSITSAKVADDAVTSAKINSTSTGMTLADLTVDTNVLKVDATNNRVGVGTASPSRQIMISRSIADGSGELGIVSSDSSTTGALGNIHFGNSTDTSLASIRATADGATDAGKLEFSTEATGGAIETALRIDSGGRVFKPRQISFIATGNNGAYINTTPIPFPTVIQNVGNGYNNSNYTFTAPVAGTYLFHVHIGLTAGAGGISVYPYLAVNGTNTTYTYQAINASTSHSNCNMTQMFALSANDTVLIRFYGGGTYYGNSPECRFMGCLLH